jgi:hypothetical protein
VARYPLLATLNLRAKKAWLKSTEPLPPEPLAALKLSNASESGGFQGLILHAHAMSVAVLADEGVKLSLSLEVIEQILHKPRHSRIDG